MMKKNIVLIETIDSLGTGILYPCNYEDEKKGFRNYYIIFTNSHVLKDVGRDTKKDHDVKELVKLQIFDDDGKCVDEEDIQEIRVYNPGWNHEKQNDIGALLVAIQGHVALTLETNIFTNNLENRATIYMEGYPGVMLDDEVCQKLQLEGISKSIFPESSKIGVYQISDDYHWYNGSQDRQLLSGLSGSPVYVERNGRGMLVGMNQSVSDIDRGKNPFKLVYYLKIEYILECLREAGCILFQRVDEYTYKVEWVYGKENIINNYTNNPAFLLIGGSGAGKSSFATDFAYHRDNLLATNDGQTTRTNVIYEYRIFENEPSAVVQFMQKEAFQERMLELKGAAGILFIFRSIFGLREDTCQNDFKILEDCSKLLDGIMQKDEDGTPTITVRAFLEDNESRKDKESLVWWYESLLKCILNKIPFSLVRYVCDREWVEKCRENYLNSYEKLFQENYVEQDNVFLEKYLFKDLQKQYKDSVVASEREKIIALIKKTGVFKKLIVYCKDTKNNFKEYLENCLAEFPIYISNIDTFEKKNQTLCEQEIFAESFKTKYIKYLLFCEGFFDITEFSFLIKSEVVQKEIKDRVGNKLIVKESKHEQFTKNLGIWDGIKSVYDECHDILINAMIVHNVGIRKNKYEITIKLNQINEGERILLQRCLQVSHGKSLTGIVLSVKIQDMISNPYAMELKSLKIAMLRIIDTHGLDHVQGMWSMEDALYDIVYNCQEQKIQLQDINVLYLKKLDSGKPDELRNILPLIYKVIPQSPVYCIFTGIDIYYQTPEKIQNISWGRYNDEKAPKAVSYILSQKGHQEMMENMQGSTERQKNMYLVLKNNLIPYCGKQELIQKSYVYYTNNVMYIRKLLASIVMKEYSSLEIINLEKLNKIVNAIDKKADINKEIQGFIEKAERLIKVVFQRASINQNMVHHQTLKADLRNIGERELLGYCRSYRHLWNQRFHEAYAEVISKMGGELAEYYNNAQGAFEAALSNMEQRFLGDIDQLQQKTLEDSIKKNDFRVLLEKMFKQKKDGNLLYEYNPFEIQFAKDELKNMGANRRKEIFHDLFNFSKGLNSEEILREFTDKFIRDLKAQIEEDNAIKAENVIMLNLDFAEALKRLENIFTEKYDIRGDKNTTNFYSIMQYYFSSKRNGLQK
jgi:hypothetical protein